VRTAALAQRHAQRHRLGRATVPVLAGFVVLVGLALGVPIGSSIYWMVRGGADSVAGVSVLSAAGTTALYSGSAALLATLAALPVALLAVRHDSRSARFLEHSTYLVLALPGVIVALAFSYFVEQHLSGWGYQTAPLLIVAYAILFFPLALVGVKASVAYAPVRLEEVGRSLGQSRWAVLRRVTLPLVGPGLAAAFCLVFLAAVTELTATLILIPTGVQTLATQFWAYTTNLSYAAAAPYAGLMILIAVIPSYILGRWFDRLPARTGHS
jgi:iron(III) transport system permease protein